jgi:hypothetical protein
MIVRVFAFPSKLKREVVMRRLYLPTGVLILALGLSLMSGVLLAQQPEETAVPTPIDCSSAGIAALMQDVEIRFPIDFAAQTSEINANLYRRGLVYQQIALECGYAPSSSEIDASMDLALKSQTVGADPVIALARIEGLPGDPSRGDALFNGEARTAFDTFLGCSTCHAGGSVAPATELIWDNTLNTRLKSPLLSAYTPEQYIVESILNPSAYGSGSYFVSMPHDFGKRLLPQDLADLVAYLHSLSADDAVSAGAPQ